MLISTTSIEALVRTSRANVATDQPKVHVFAITIKALESEDVLVSKLSTRVCWGGNPLRTSFTPPLVLTPDDVLTVNLLYQRQGIAKKTGELDISFQELFDARLCGKQEWNRVLGKTEVVIDLSPEVGTSKRNKPLPNVNNRLVPTKNEILRVCPRFRVLVIGKTGVGKSSLINHVFGIDEGHAHEIAGEANIDKEILSAKNDRFVLHDAGGFEPGAVDNVEIVRQFIKKRSQMPNVKDQLHAVWLCFEVPVAVGWLLDTGSEAFLNLKTSGELGRIPVIAVFTKFDKLVNLVQWEAGKLTREEQNGTKEAQADAENILQERCTHLLNPNIPHVKVSKAKKYENTLADLLKITFDNVAQYTTKESSIVSAMAQRADPGVKIEGSIAVGRTRYWKGLASSDNFTGRTLKECLDVIHTDVLAVWDMNDPHKHLYSREFKVLISSIADNVTDRRPDNPNNQHAGHAVVGKISSIVPTLAGPTAPIVIPIKAGFVFAEWVHDVYQGSINTLGRLMAYIVDLTLIMQNIFLLTQGYSFPVSRRSAKLASRAYSESGTMTSVHFAIQEHVTGMNTFKHIDRDHELDKIIELIHRFAIDCAEIAKGKELDQIDQLEPDDVWD